eukprot:211117_1
MSHTSAANVAVNLETDPNKPAACDTFTSVSLPGGDWDPLDFDTVEYNLLSDSNGLPVLQFKATITPQIVEHIRNGKGSESTGLIVLGFNKDGTVDYESAYSYTGAGELKLALIYQKGTLGASLNWNIDCTAQ